MKAKNKVHNISEFAPTQNFHHYSLQYLMKNVLTVAQCFALLPVCGIRGKTDELRFKWKSVKTIYTLLAIILVAIYSAIVMANSIITNEGFLSFVEIVWNVRSLIGLMVFFRLAQKWPKFLQEWAKVEIDMLHYGALPTLTWRYRIASIGFVVAALTEHFMYMYGTGIRIVLAKIKPNESFAQLYFETVHAAFFDIFEYSPWKAIYVKFSDVVTAFVWQFTDCFLILMTSTLAERFRQINAFIIKEKVLTEAQWRLIRKQYNNLSMLCNLFNTTLSGVILLSFSANVYFLSIALFQSLSVQTTFETIFVWFNVIFILTHFSLVSMYAAWVHEESIELIPKISSLPLKHVNHEVDRLLNQMAERDIGIYGAGFFKVTRSVVLNVVNVIVTLQLIFVQFQATFSPKAA